MTDLRGQESEGNLCREDGADAGLRPVLILCLAERQGVPVGPAASTCKQEQWMHLQPKRDHRWQQADHCLKWAMLFGEIQSTVAVTQ